MRSRSNAPRFVLLRYLAACQMLSYSARNSALCILFYSLTHLWYSFAASRARGCARLSRVPALLADLALFLDFVYCFLVFDEVYYPPSLRVGRRFPHWSQGEHGLCGSLHETLCFLLHRCAFFLSFKILSDPLVNLVQGAFLNETSCTQSTVEPMT